MYYTEERINLYSKGLSDSEKEQCERTIRIFENLLKKYGFSMTKKNFDEMDEEDLNYRYHIRKDNLEFTVFLQGSYGNGTCVKKDSDVDIAMICESTFIAQYPNGRNRTSYGFTSSTFNILEFKKDFFNHIKNLGYNVKNKNKCIFIEGNQTSNKDMDIVPSLRYRNYENDRYCDPNNYIYGVLIKTNDNREIINYPEQSRINSIKKNKETSYYYKKIVRVLKNIKNDLLDEYKEYEDYISSYAIECLTYNVPNSYFSSNSGEISIKQITNNVLYYLQNQEFINFYETNELLKIFENPNNKIQKYKSFIRLMKKSLESSYGTKVA